MIIKKIIKIIKFIFIAYMLLLVNSYLIFFILRLTTVINKKYPISIGLYSVALLLIEILIYYNWRKKNRLKN